MNELSSSPTSLLFLQAAKHAAPLARQTFNHFLHSASSVTQEVGSKRQSSYTIISQASCGRCTRTNTKTGNHLLERRNLGLG